jgi:subtilisin-like proprotein convertase family protein
MQGVWTLTVSDGANEDGGQLQSWSLNICYDVDGYILAVTNPIDEVCAGTNANYTVNVNQLGAYNDPVTLSVSGLPAGASAAWSTNPVVPGNNAMLSITTAGVASGNYTVTINATSSAGTQSTDVALIVNNPPVAPIILSSPADNASDLALPVSFTWAASPAPGVTYQIDISSNSDFSNIVETQNGLNATNYIASNLQATQTYYWRVRATNVCGTNAFSATRTFETESCQTFASTNVPITISASGTPTITSTINVAQSGTINNLDVLNLIGTHTWVSDLTVSLTSPQNTTVQLFSGICTNQDNFDLNFSDAAAPGAIPCPPTTGLTYQPTGSLADFNGEDMQGVWTLTVSDGFNQDGGQLQSWSLNICYTPDPCPTPSVEPTSIDLVGTPFCLGGDLTLSPVGGSLASGAQWEWFSGSCNGTPIGTGNSVTVSPTANTDYFVRAGAGTGCPETSCASLNFQIPTVGNNLSIDGDAATCVVNSGDWVHFYNANGRLIASVNSNGQNLGEVNASSFVNNDPYILGACDDPSNSSFLNAVLARSFIITPDVQPSNPVAVRLYISEAEFLAYQTAAQNTTGNPFDNVNTIADMHLTKHSSAQQQGLPSDICAGGSSSFIMQNASGNTSSIFAAIGSSYYLEYVIDGFSQFFPMNANNSSLPVSLTSFEAICKAFNIELNWTTASEQNASHFRIESSRDGSTWLLLGEVEAGGNSSQALTYQFVDQKINNTNLYYRLVQVDLDGSETSYPPLQISCEENQNSAEVFPNPNNGSFHLAIQSASNFGKRTISISDLTGKIVHSLEINLASGSYLIHFEHLNLAQGAYILQIPGLEDQFKPLRIIVGP